MSGACRGIGRAFWYRITRRKHIDAEDTSTELKRCLSTKRLIFIGVGKTVGVGIYVLIGVATQNAGPAVVLSFLIGGFVTLLNALCFTEFAAKTPKTGAQYTYMYETIGEGVAFLVGWTCAIGYISAFSLASRGFSGYFDSVFNHAIKNFTMTHITHWLEGPYFPEYPDFVAILVVLVVMVISSIGVNFSSKVNTVLAAVSGSLLVFIAIAGLVFADSKNWFGLEGGYFPNGISGVFKAAAASFYAFQGFEIIGFSSEEAENPKKVIPRAMIGTFVIVTFLYMSVAVSFSLMIPYTHINKNAPFPGAFAYHHVDWVKYITAVGPMFALFNLCILELYTISRTIYSMSTDGLLFKFCSTVNQKTKIPLGPIIVFGPVVIILVLLTDLENLLGFMVMYTFIQYSFFAAYMTVLRYNQPLRPSVQRLRETDHDEVEIEVKLSESHLDRNEHDDRDNIIAADGGCDDSTETGNNSERLLDKRGTNQADSMQIESECNAVSPDFDSDRDQIQGSKCCKLSKFFTVTKLVIIIYISSFLLALQLHVFLEGAHISGILVFSTLSLSLVILTCCFGICLREQHGRSDGFQVPLMPFLPVLSILGNMVMLVSVADKGNIIAAVTMAGIGASVYILMIVTDILRNRGKTLSDDGSAGEYSQLLTETDDDALDADVDNDR